VLDAIELVSRLMPHFLWEFADTPQTVTARPARTARHLIRDQVGVNESGNATRLVRDSCCCRRSDIIVDSVMHI